VVEWVAHTGNANPAAVVAELAVKPDLDMALTTHTASWVKIAATGTISMEISQDFEVFMKFVRAARSTSQTRTRCTAQGGWLRMCDDTL
jgi:hypothetical protein